MSHFELLSDAITIQLFRMYLGDKSAEVPETITEVRTDLFESVVYQRDLLRFLQGAADKALLKIGISSSSKTPLGNTLRSAIDLTIHALHAPASLPSIPKAQLKASTLSSQYLSAIADRLQSYSPDVHRECLRLVEEISRYVIEICLSITPFDRMYAGESVLQVLRSADNLDSVINAVWNLEGQRHLLCVTNRVDPQFLKFETDYRFAVVRELDKVELFGVDIRPEAQRNVLSDAFISLNIQHGEGDQGEYIQFAAMLDRLSREKGRVLIRGAAGSGKSTLLRWAAISAAKYGSASFYHEYDKAQETIATRLDSDPDISNDDLAEIQAESEKWRHRIPFLILLRACQDGQLPTPEQLCRHLSNELSNAPEEWIHRTLDSGRAIILIDGIDEVPVLNRHLIWGGVKDLTKQYSKAYFVITTRPEAVPRGWLHTLNFFEADIAPMSRHDVARFIRKWHEAVQKEAIRRGRPIGDLHRLATDLIEKLKEAVILPLASNPLLCAMICALHHYRSGRLPNNLRNICESLCEMLLHRREVESGLNLAGFPAPWPDMMYEQKRYVTQEIATELVFTEESSMSTEDALQCIGRALEQLPDRRAAEAHVVLRALIERSGMVRQASPPTAEKAGTIDFIHNTFKEYLAAERFAVRGDVQFLRDKCLSDPTWKRVAWFAVQSNNEVFSNAFIAELINWRPTFGDSAKIRRAMELFALQCRAVTVSLDPALNSRIEKMLSDVFPPKSLEEGQLIASIGTIAVPYLASRPDMSEIETAACIRALRLIGGREAMEKLPDYLYDERKAVVQELALWIDPLLIPFIIRVIRKGQQIPEGVREQVGVLSALAEIDDLECLNLAGAADAEWSSIPELYRLHTLIIRGSPVKSIPWISNCPNLEKLDMAGSHVEDIAPLRSLNKLQHLNASGCPVFDFRPLAEIGSLVTLQLNDTGIHNLSVLSQLTSLETLEINNTKVSELSPVVWMKKLKSINAENASITSLDICGRLGTVERLNVKNNPIENIYCGSGSSLLAELDLRGTKVSDISALSKASSLRALKVRGDLDLESLADNDALNINDQSYRDWAAPFLRKLIFISYAQADEEWFELIRKNLVTTPEQCYVWSHGNAKASTNVIEEVLEALPQTRVGVLLVSQEYFASEFQMEIELKTLLQDMRECGVKIVWIPVDVCTWEQTPLRNIRAASSTERPLRTVSKRDEAKKIIVKAVSTIVEMYRGAGNLRRRPSGAELSWKMGVRQTISARGCQSQESGW